MTNEDTTTVRMTVSLDLDIRIYPGHPEYYDLDTGSSFSDIVKQEIELVETDSSYLGEYLAFNPVHNVRVTQIEIRDDAE